MFQLNDQVRVVKGFFKGKRGKLIGRKLSGLMTPVYYLDTGVYDDKYLEVLEEELTILSGFVHVERMFSKTIETTSPKQKRSKK